MHHCARACDFWLAMACFQLGLTHAQPLPQSSWHHTTAVCDVPARVCAPGTRYDALGGSNFHVPLRLALSSMAEITIDDEILIPEEQLPDLPQELCGIWAYIQWEAAGCPNRSSGDSDAAYQDAIQVRVPVPHQWLWPGCSLQTRVEWTVAGDKAAAPGACLALGYQICWLASCPSRHA